MDEDLCPGEQIVSEIESPGEVFVRDLVGDDSPDLLISTRTQSRIYVLEGDGSGAFFPYSSFESSHPEWVRQYAFGDFDHDGFEDIAFCASTVAVSWGPDFRTVTQESAFIPGGVSSGVLALDVDRDGRVELVMDHDSDSEVLVYQGSSTRTFQPVPLVLENPDAHVYRGPFFAVDEDADGSPEILSRTFTGAAVHRISKSGSEWTWNVSQTIDCGLPTHSVGLGDLDGDGIEDLICVGTDSEVVVCFGERQGGPLRFSEPSLATRVNGAVTAAVPRFTDFDLNGQPEAWFRSWYLEATPRRKLRAAQPVLPPDFRAQAFAEDLDRDGFADLVHGGSILRILPGGPEGLGDPILFPEISWGSSSSMCGAVDRDGSVVVLVRTQPTAGVALRFRGDIEDPEITPLAGNILPFPTLLTPWNEADLRAVSVDGGAAIVRRLDGNLLTIEQVLMVPSDARQPLASDLDGDRISDLVYTVSGGAGVVFGSESGLAAGFASITISPERIQKAFTFDVDRDGVSDIVVETLDDENCRVADRIFRHPSERWFTERLTTFCVDDVDSDVQIDLDSDGSGDVLFPSEFELDLRFVLDGHGLHSPRTLAALRGLDDGAVVAIDADGDGLADVASILFGELHVAYGRSDALLDPSPRRRHRLLDAISASLSGDLDGDGSADFVVREEHGATWSLLNDGSGTFSTPRQISRSSYPLALGDFDGDGDLDYVGQGPANETLYFRGRGQGSFELARTLPAAGEPSFRATSGDLDNDGFTDLVVRTTNRSARVYLGREDFENASGFSIEFPDQLEQLSLLPIDGDDNLDLAVLLDGPGSPPRLHVLPGNGDGTFGALQSTTVALLPTARLENVLKDVNGDGLLDTISARSDRLVAFLSDGSFGFTEVPLDTRSPVAFVSHVIDLNGDGVLDLVGGWVFDPFSVYPGLGTLGFGAGISFQSDRIGADAMALDVDNDGFLELVASAGRDLITYEAHPQEYLLLPRAYSSVSPRELLLADVDGDDAPELLGLTRINEEIVCFELTPNRELVVLGTSATGWSSLPTGTPLGVHDVDGDGLLDALTAVDGIVAWHKGEGNGRFGLRQTLASGVGFSTTIATADLANDGVAELVLRGPTVLRDAGAPGAFRLDGAYRLGNATSRRFLGDLNGDGSLDAVHFEENRVHIALGDGLEGFSAPRFLHGDVPANRLGIVTVGDFDGDGRSSVVVGPTGTGRPIVWSSSPTRTWRHQELQDPLRMDGAVVAADAADLDLDGDLDLVLVRESHHAVAYAADDRGDLIPTHPILGTTPGLSNNVGGSQFLLADFVGTRVPDIVEASADEGVFLIEADRGSDSGGPSAALFRRGDPNMDGREDMSDAVTIVSFLFHGRPERLACETAADADDNGLVEVADAVRILGFFFLGTAAPAPPFRRCDADETPDDLSCVGHGACP